ncbi:MAG: FtsQ-type POTRA domain-containing protein [Armatimonadota bacterium]|nr:FtsQ-type POTRA domain-containing protein [Armatimonadota bacterium]MDR7444002.1 FtsQ-type POTRA domain-containing protein [Armatimonadota bacterium]MDR7615395.1 FtsQ-type POTRA domain-containing protein [Armatimonadota bacterium]
MRFRVRNIPLLTALVATLALNPRLDAQAPEPAPSPGPTPEGPQRIVDIQVQGLQRIPPEVVFGRIGSRAGELLDRDRIRQDVEQILGSGWFADVLVRIQPVPEGVVVVFLVVENPVVQRVEITGNTAVSTEEIREALGVQEGRVLNTVDLRTGARNVEKLYQDRGYPLVRVADVEFREGVLRVEIREGRVERVEVRGLRRTRPVVVQRVLQVRENDLFHLPRVQRDLQEVFATGLFENVRANPQPGSDPDKVVLVIEVEERPSREVGGGVGYSPQAGFLGRVQYTERNLHGMGRSVALSYERNLTSLTGQEASLLSGLPTENLLIQYRDPWFGMRGQALSLELHDTAQLFDDRVLGVRYLQLLEGGSVSLSRRLTDALSLSLGLRTDRGDFVVLEGDGSKIQFSRGLVHAFRVEATYDSRDRPFAATRGQNASAFLDYGTRLLGGDFEFGKLLAEYVHYVPVWQGTLVGRVRAGVSAGNLPLQEQYLVGGPQSVRGLPIGALRGQSMTLASLEYRLPLRVFAPGLESVTLAVFVDAGGVAASGFGLLEQPQLSYGAGVLVQSPLGPIRIDYAIGPGGQTQTWLQFGNPF